MKKIRLADKAVKLIIYEAFVERKLKGLPRHLLPLVHKLYFEPQYEEFEARNLWSLSNAFTSALKGLAPIKHFELTARLSTFLGGLQERQDVKLFFQSKEAIENKFRLAAERLEAEDFFSQSDRFTEVDDFDEDDVAEDPSEAEEFDPYFDEEAETEAIDEAEAELPNEFIRRAA